ncbi:MAG: slipin family protein [Candidatus Pacebacteria bacterium]|nr:slipin family protein [Candidatus Paceibacterota bacterium]
MNFVWLWIIVAYLILGLRVINQYQRGVVLTLGKYSRTFSPGLKLIFVGFQTVINVDLRIVTIDIPQQETITKDNVPVGINAVVYFRVKKAEDAILNVENYRYAVSQYAMAALRDVIGGVELDELLTKREKLASDIKSIVESRTDEWGIEVVDIKMQDIELPADMKRAMAKQAESERERRAIVIKSQGEIQAAENLARAADILKSVPGGISIRTLQTIEKLQPDPSKMTVFALPIEVLEGIKMINQNKEEKQ